MEDGVERRTARRFSMMLPLRVRLSSENGAAEKQGETRDISYRGLYFLIEAKVEAGNRSRWQATCTSAVTRACCAWSRTTADAEWPPASNATSSFPPAPDASRESM